MVHIHNGILLGHKKEWNNALCSNMDATRDYHTKWSKPDRERQIYHLYVKLKERRYNWTYIWNRNRPTDIVKKVRGDQSRREGHKLGFGINTYTLFCIK